MWDVTALETSNLVSLLNNKGQLGHVVGFKFELVSIDSIKFGIYV